MFSRIAAIPVAGIAAVALAGAAAAQPPMPKPQHDYHAAPAGKYVLDQSHTGVIARVPHMGFSYEIIRFEKVSGELGWDPAHPAADTLKVSVDANSMATVPIPGFPERLEGMIKAGQYPTVTFVSKAFTPEGPTHGKVEGTLTLMGVARPATFDVTLVGAGKGFKGPVIGIHATTLIDPHVYGLPPFITAPIEMVIDSEFDAQS